MLTRGTGPRLFEPDATPTKRSLTNGEPPTAAATSPAFGDWRPVDAERRRD
jgi:hypothetical protein